MSFVPNNMTETTGNSSVDVAIRKFHRAMREYNILLNELLARYGTPNMVPENNRGRMIRAATKVRNMGAVVIQRMGSVPPSGRR